MPRTSGSPPTSTATAGSRTSRATSPRTSRTSRPSSASTARSPSTPAASASSRAITSRARPTSAFRSTGVGLFYRAGYFRQSIGDDGWQRESYPLLDPYGLGLTLLRDDDGAPVEITLDLPGDRQLHARVWIADIGRIPLLLLDSETPSNSEEMRRVTDRLYGGGGEHRLLQELLLGVGGVRAVRAWSGIAGKPAPDVYHTNEGHAGFQGLERMSELITQHGLDFDQALAQVRASTVFTTHTPVPAGIDRFPRDLIADFLASDLFAGLDAGRAISLGLETYEGGDQGVFNMAVLGLHLGQHANGVSVLHGEVSRGMFGQLWPGVDTDEVPITSITNGVHAPTWVHPSLKAVSERAWGNAAHRHARLDRPRCRLGWRALGRPPAR